MNKFAFKTDSKGEWFCTQIANYMVSLFSISKEEAIARINQEWKKRVITGVSSIYHVVPEEWAKEIYWGHDSYWWIEGEKREELKLSPLVPQPLRKL